MFAQLSLAPVDPILGLTEQINQDERPTKINLGVGVYQDDQGATTVLSSVKQAEAHWLQQQTSKSYLSIAGLADYNQQVQSLVFGEAHPLLAQQRAVTVQTPGGTAALRVAATLLAKQLGHTEIWISNPSWANHQAVFSDAGLTVHSYPYYHAPSHSLDFAAMLAQLERLPKGAVVLLHGCCHNPSGVDPTPQQWQQLLQHSLQHGWVPFFDLAYQGLGDGLEQDAYALRLFAQQHTQMIVASSFSKNFGLYNERVGALTVVADTAQSAQAVLSQLCVNIRTLYSNPPSHGALVVAHVLTTPSLKALWQDELQGMCQRMQKMRALLVSRLHALQSAQDFGFITQQKGMFSFLGLDAQQVSRLRDDYAIYMVGSGRINIAGITSHNCDALAQAIAAVL